MVCSLSPSLQHLSAWPVKYFCKFLTMAEHRKGFADPCVLGQNWDDSVTRPDLLLPKHTLGWVSLSITQNLYDDCQRTGSMRTRYIQRSWLTWGSYKVMLEFHMQRHFSFVKEKWFVRNDVPAEWFFIFKSWIWPWKQLNSSENLSFQVNVLLLISPTVTGLGFKYTQSTS